jgi:membrane-associated phospholipid phosphatase
MREPSGSPPSSAGAYAALADSARDLADPFAAGDSSRTIDTPPASGNFETPSLNASRLGDLAPEFQSEALLSLYGDAEARLEYVAVFPPSFELALKSFDDFWINALQRRFIESGSRLPRLYATAMTGLTAVELGVCVPVVLHFLGWDALASRAAVLMFVLCFFSQIPKRFLWRARPYMTQPPRAIKVREDKTSSFPSRAVTCAVAFGYFVANVVSDNGTNQNHLWIATLCICVVWGLSAAFARVYFGVHYPSDCVGGSISGTIISLVSTQIYRAEWMNCTTCNGGACYASNADSALSFATWSNIPGRVFAVAVALSFALTLVSVVPPIRFWVKCSHIFGMLLPCIVFRTTFLCRELNVGGFALPAPVAAPGIASMGVAVLCLLVVMPLGFLASKKLKKHGAPVQLAMFALIFALELSALCLWRLGGKS